MCLLGVLTFDGIIKLRTNFLTTGGRAASAPTTREKAVKIPWDTKGNIVPMRIVPLHFRLGWQSKQNHYSLLDLYQILVNRASSLGSSSYDLYHGREFRVGPTAKLPFFFPYRNSLPYNS